MANIIQTFPKGNGTDLSIIAEEFDSTKDYKVGDKVIKDKKYYVFTSDHDAGAWDSSDVDETNVSEEIPIGLTDEDMDEIKAQFHPRQIGNVTCCHLTESADGKTIYYKSTPFIGTGNWTAVINSETGVDDIDGGYGFTTEKPFATLEYAISKAPTMANGQISFNIQGTFTKPTLTALTFMFPGNRININILDTTVFENYKFFFNSCAYVNVLLKENLTINITDTTIPSYDSIFACNCGTTLYVSANNASASSSNPILLTLNGNNTVKTYLTGFRADQGSTMVTTTNNVKLVSNNFNNGFYAVSGRISIQAIGGTGNNTGIFSNGGIIQYETSTVAGTTATKKARGGQIYTG